MKMISSIIRRFAVYSIEKDPVFVALTEASDVLKGDRPSEKKFDHALQIISNHNVVARFERLLHHWGKIKEIRGAAQAYENAKRMLSTCSPYSLQAVLRTVQYLRNAEHEIRHTQMPTQIHEKGRAEPSWKMSCLSRLIRSFLENPTDRISPERLQKSMKDVFGILDEGTPTAVKTVVNRINRKSVETRADLEKAADDVKEAIRKLDDKDPRRTILQFIVLKPMQLELGRKIDEANYIQDKKKYIVDMRNLYYRKEDRVQDPEKMQEYKKMMPVVLAADSEKIDLIKKSIKDAQMEIEGGFRLRAHDRLNKALEILEGLK